MVIFLFRIFLLIFLMFAPKLFKYVWMRWKLTKIKKELLEDLNLKFDDL